MSRVTVLLQAHREGDASALDELAAILYPELKALAKAKARGSAGVGATTLVNETFVKLLSNGALQPEDKHQFFALTATVMRQIVIDEIRYVTARKRARKDATLIDTIMGDDGHEQADFILQVDEMLTEVAATDGRLAKVFEFRYFAGLSTAETADAMGLSNRSVERLWSSAKARIAELIGPSNA
ncbi:MAG: ECF-type sigma factor [Pseudomonadota bacterium]